jgi:hypothetical protein
MPTTYAVPNGRTAFNPVLYTGTSATQSITGVGFQPDFVWLKARSGAFQHGQFDAVRGATKGLVSNTTDAETTFSAVTSFNSNGFTNGTDYNNSGTTYVSWNWKANGAGSSNTAGSITSTVSANTTAGFSVVTYTGTGANATIGHGLGAVPKMIIVKDRTSALNWRVYHVSTGNDGGMFLNTTGAYASNSGMWNSTTPTSTVFTVGTDQGTNFSTDSFVAYCFAEVAGYSAFGSYTGNGSTDGPFIYTGFKPAFVVVKRTNTTGDWPMVDSTRDPYNVAQYGLYANSSISEASFGSPTPMYDFNSNGFKIRNTFANTNASGGTYIYMAFASNPFKYANAG